MRYGERGPVIKNVFIAAALAALVAYYLASPRFSELAFGEPAPSIDVLEFDSKVVDNLFKSEYSWLLDISSNEAQLWMERLQLGPYDAEADGMSHVPEYLARKFENQKLHVGSSALYHLGEGPNGREHYLVVFADRKMAIYYVSTV